MILYNCLDLHQLDLHLLDLHVLNLHQLDLHMLNLHQLDLHVLDLHVFVKRKCEQKGPQKVSTFSTRFHVVSNAFPKYQMLTF